MRWLPLAGRPSVAIADRPRCGGCGMVCVCVKDGRPSLVQTSAFAARRRMEGRGQLASAWQDPLATVQWGVVSMGGMKE